MLATATVKNTKLMYMKNPPSRKKSARCVSMVLSGPNELRRKRGPR